MPRRTRGVIIGLIAMVAASAIAVVASAGAPSATSVVNYQSYVGGKGKANAKLAPVLVGYINQQGGKVVIGADATTGAQAAVTWINNNAGGIKGHPLKLVTCFIKTAEEEGTTCGQKLGNNRNVKLILVGGVATGIQSFFSTIAGKKAVETGVAVTPVDGAQKNTAVLFGDSTHVLGPMGTYAKSILHAKTAAVVYPNTATVTPGAKAIIAGLKAAGVSVKSASYPQGQADLTGPLTASGAASADMVVPYADASGCADQAKALKQLGITNAKKIVSAPLCLNPLVSAALGGDYPIWTYSIASSLYGDKLDKGMPAYIAATKGLKVAPDPWVIVDFGEVLTAARTLNQVGLNGTSAQIIRALKAFKGPQALGAPQLACGSYKSAPGICNDRTQFFTYKGKNQFARAAGWLQPPASLK